ncbi:YhdP family protein [Shewanella sp. NIFS-20-20]|uniref:YhdP family protein n=1 Tax=Shewanella sp. NIFS-20-20 TaxID=2853806 RepID=UPI001C472D4E|nr:YhdP family protein [Shewanella sp. NIFS-20-20]MBV7315311.1 TIGR02099 family protein [Shewanella sp. NIFS-20-20]
MSSIASFCWKSLAVLLVVFALMVSLVRSLLPQVDHVRQQLVQLLEQEFQLQVELEGINADWQAYGPELRLNQLLVPQQADLPISLAVDSVQIKLDFWQSLLHLEPQIQDVKFSGVTLGLDLEQLALSEPQKNIDWLYALLLGQLQRYSITDLQLDLYRQNRHFKPIHIDQLNWLNQGQRHVGEGVVYLDAAAKDTELLSLRVDIKGDSNDPASLSGQIYAIAKDLELAKWAETQVNPYQPDQSLPLTGIVNFQAWLEVEGRHLGMGMLEFGRTQLSWDLNDKPQDLAIERGQLQWRALAGGWQLFSHDLQLQTNQQPWPVTDFLVNQDPKGLHAQLSVLKPELLLPLLPLLPGVTLEQLLQYQRMAPKGELSQLVWQQSPQSWQFSAHADGLSWGSDGQIPGVASLDFDVAATADNITVALAEQGLSLDYPAMFPQTLSVNMQATQLHYQLPQQRLLVPDLQLENDDVRLDAALKLDFADSVTLALAANADLKDVATIQGYFPEAAMGQALADYLAAALKSGESHGAQVVWQGAFNQFPFAEHQGKFQAGFRLDKAEFEFLPDWPAVSDIRLDALFDNARMDLWLRQGRLLKVDASGAHIAIPQLGDRSLLIIAADIEAQGQDATEVMLQSPLKDSVGATLEVVNIQGKVGAALDLAIPLYEADAEINGVVSLDNVPVYISEPGLQLEQVQASIAFHNDKVTGKDLQAILFGQPVQLSVSTEPLHQDYALDVTMAGQWDLGKLSRQFDLPLSQYYQGELDWQGRLNMVFDDAGYRLQARVTSDLAEAELGLPSPLTKPIGDKLALTAELIGDNKQSHLGIKLGQLAEFWGGFTPKSGKHVAYFDLMLGRNFKLGDQLVKQDGALWLALNKVDLAPWLKVIDEISQGEGSGVLPPLQQLSGKIKHLTAYDQPINALSIEGVRSPSSWQLALDSDALAGSVNIYPDWYNQGIKLSAQRLYLSRTSKDSSPSPSDPEPWHLPPIALDVDDFRYDNKQLGHLVLQAAPAELGYQIQTLSLSAPGISVVGSGYWHDQAPQNYTELDWRLSAEAFDLISERLQIDPGLKEAPLDLNATLTWQGSPFDFSVASLNGDVNFTFGKGHLSQISDKGARIFSLFSLDSLLRKLSLDFSDVFGQGLYFNAFSGNLKIDNGVVKTTDTEMDAIAGNMKVRGYTDLATESLNYDIRFVPQLASSVPTVVLLSTSAWTMGVGAFALTKVLEPVIEVISEIRFRVTGTMSDPKLEELERKSKEIEIPESILPAKPASPGAASAKGSSSQTASKPEIDVQAIEAAKEADGGSQTPSHTEGHSQY